MRADLLRVRRAECTVVPVEIADAVELWARGCGRHATITYITVVDPPIAQVRITLRPDDGRLDAWRKGLVDEEPIEAIELVEWDEKHTRYVPLNLTELGASGVTALLERGNLWSGRGEFDSLQQAIVAVRERAKVERERERLWRRGESLARLEEKSRHHLDIPQVPGADLHEGTE